MVADRGNEALLHSALLSVLKARVAQESRGEIGEGTVRDQETHLGRHRGLFDSELNGSRSTRAFLRKRQQRSGAEEPFTIRGTDRLPKDDDSLKLFMESPSKPYLFTVEGRQERRSPGSPRVN